MVVTLLAAVILKTFVVDAVYIPSVSMESTLLVGDYVFVNKLIYGSKPTLPAPFTNSWIPLFHLPAIKSIERGDVVLFRFPGPLPGWNAGGQVHFVKRVVGVGGDTIEIRNGSVFVNGTRSSIFVPGSSYPAQSFNSIIIPRRGDSVRLTKGNYPRWKNVLEQEGHASSIDASGSIVVDGKKTSMYSPEKDFLFVVGDNVEHSYDSRDWGLLSAENVVGRVTMIYWSMVPGTSTTNKWFLPSIRWNRLGRFIQ
jgi:signal peptidase I